MSESKATSESHTDTARMLDEFLKTNTTVDFIRFLWVGYNGVVNTRVVTKAFAIELAETESPVTTASPILTAIAIYPVELRDLIDLGEDQLWPDWSSLKVCHYHSRHAQVMCWVKNEGIKHGRGFSSCPRKRLQEIIDSAGERHGLDFLVEFELEFYMTDKDGTAPLEVVPNLFSTANLRNRCLPILEEIVDVLTKAGIRVRQFHSEFGQGSFEISTDPLPPLQAVDALVYSQESIKTVCANRGVHATMVPKPFEKLSGVGLHFHLSMSPTEGEESFLAGMLEHWAALAAFYMPNYDSYQRIKPGSAVSWGYQNRSASIRKLRDGYWELRGPDGTINPYLTLAAILCAGLHGLDNDTELKMRNLNRLVNDDLTGEEEESLRIIDRMPTSLKAALEKLATDHALTETLGEEIVQRYLVIKSREEEVSQVTSSAERRRISMGVF